MCKTRSRISGLDGAELFQSYSALKQLRATLTYMEEEAEGEAQSSKLEVFAGQINKVLEMMESRLDDPQSTAFSAMTDTMLEDRLNIVHAGDLHLKSDHAQRIEQSRFLGNQEHMSSQHMHQHLAMLDGLVPRTSEAAARLWIDTLFFRAAAMVPADKRMVLNIEPSTAIHTNSNMSIPRKIEYTAVVAPLELESLIFQIPALDSLKRRLPTGFFVIEGKIDLLFAQLPQACAELYGCAKIIGKNTVRGALTNGNEWFFIILQLNANEQPGATYRHTLPLAIVSTVPSRTAPAGADLIAGILSFWIQHGSEDIQEDDWFTEVQNV
ncbi:hypothetical protein C8R44DRAFT_780994 [Mycena epipterygia]|nr:hypothetical protein C8R44DRAFT_780994 [Mycena epipterygia]